MEAPTINTLDLWREEGTQHIRENFEAFRDLVAKARDFAQCGHYDAAAIYGQIAAYYAQFKHCGLFASSELEDILFTIGKNAMPRNVCPLKRNSFPEKPKNILHIATSVSGIGGHSQMLRRWIQQDAESCHSLVITQGTHKEIPRNLQRAIFKSRGKIYRLTETVGTVVSWAKRLQRIATQADLVVLHIYNYDIIPILAFANKEKLPSVIFLNHTDHNFWIGTNISDVVANLRESGMRLSQERRGIDAQRNVLLPTLIEPSHRILSRSEAKRQLGLDEESTILLSIARGPKYKTIDGNNYLEAHIPLLEQYQQAILIIVGPDINDYRNDWLVIVERMKGRILVIKEREDTAVFHQAADIYVDSFPFVSITSLLEAGSYGVPLVSRYPYPSDASDILGADMPGLTGNLIRVKGLEEYTSVLSRLVEDEELRLNLGEATRKKILEKHTGDDWQRSLNEIYHLATIVPRVTSKSAMTDEMVLDEPDVFLPRVHGRDISVDNLIQSHLRILPLDQRLVQWFRLVKKYGFHYIGGRFGPLTYLAPEWLLFRLRQIL